MRAALSTCSSPRRWRSRGSSPGGARSTGRSRSRYLPRSPQTSVGRGIFAWIVPERPPARRRSRGSFAFAVALRSRPLHCVALCPRCGRRPRARAAQGVALAIGYVVAVLVLVLGISRAALRGAPQGVPCDRAARAALAVAALAAGTSKGGAVTGLGRATSPTEAAAAVLVAGHARYCRGPLSGGPVRRGLERRARRLCGDARRG